MNEEKEKRDLPVRKGEGERRWGMRMRRGEREREREGPTVVQRGRMRVYAPAGYFGETQIPIFKKKEKL